MGAADEVDETHKKKQQDKRDEDENQGELIAQL